MIAHDCSLLCLCLLYYHSIYYKLLPEILSSFCALFLSPVFDTLLCYMFSHLVKTTIIINKSLFMPTKVYARLILASNKYDQKRKESFISPPKIFHTWLLSSKSLKYIWQQRCTNSCWFYIDNRRRKRYVMFWRYESEIARTVVTLGGNYPIPPSNTYSISIPNMYLMNRPIRWRIWKLIWPSWSWLHCSM